MAYDLPVGAPRHYGVVRLVGAATGQDVLGTAADLGVDDLYAG